MAIKVIKHGTKVFRVTCPICGCEFEYELSDLTEEVDKESLTYGAKVKVVKCPECNEKIKHQEYKEVHPDRGYPVYPSYPWTPIYPNKPDTVPWTPTYPNIIYTTTTDSLDCATCPNRPDPNHPIVGDTPCTWCRKNQPYCTCYNKK